MNSIGLSLVVALLSISFAGSAHAAEIRITGAAAAELYAKLALPETSVQDEHGGPVTATAKYGDRIGCQLSLEGLAECWIQQ